ncbi:RING-H2 finger protein ATL3-like [Gastrolobium bilobum]|uniref:RING-H2 finger protein ATL3-like n=1 Tax=Gastrolobium bilobum TaxID=150636 RepID=UPI002AB19D3B|nr:RING-H2 finger protein ATL3-like [Gastrolobium bilobum]
MGAKYKFEITGNVRVVAVIFLCMVVTIVLILLNHAKWLRWRIEQSTAPQPRNRRRFVFAPGQDPVTYGTNRIGLDPAVLRSLPVLVFQQEDFKDGLECAVCLSEIVQGEKARLLPKCNHGFHVDCIDMWFQSHSTCPLCRNLVDSESSNSDPFEAENSATMSGLESSNFPTNVLVWGDRTQVSSVGVSLEEGTSYRTPCSTSSSSSSSSASDSSNCRCHGMLVIDIPSEFNSSSLSPSASRCDEDEMKSPMTARLRSLKRLLSRDKKLSPCSPSSMDVEQAQS